MKLTTLKIVHCGKIKLEDYDSYPGKGNPVVLYVDNEARAIVHFDGYNWIKNNGDTILIDDGDIWLELPQPPKHLLK